MLVQFVRVFVLVGSGGIFSFCSQRELRSLYRLVFFWRLSLDSGHKSSQVCSSASIDLWRFIDYKGFSEEESGMLLASNMINMGEAVITKESRVAPTT